MGNALNLPIILASGSPRRKELLGILFEDFEVIVSDCEEVVTSNVPEEVTKELALQKAEAVVNSEQVKKAALVIGSDTVVSIDDKILGKPKNRQDAMDMIWMLSGKTHKVSTGVAILMTDSQGNIVKERSFSETTLVRVAELSEPEVKDYVNSGDCDDKAGSYGIQGIFAKHIEGIEGDYNNVVGLPVHRLYKEWKDFLKEKN